ncbi:acireductone synthase [Streptomyces roseolilacinus]|uniref:Enolase-phosphatase E1 n=1 Tax=Streptomyces roseolilacinus TaxID=66904 RepID=A0A918EJB0_9ACTN|nr:acireductone synthase [Streptomyces roseolilacinus]GGP95833.1 enolase-phosphatase E1 [Streptomyces roseolilacinus]
MILSTVRAVVLDIEGTTGSASHVHDVLFPYARERFADWLAAHRGEAPWTELMEEIRTHTGDARLDEGGAVAALTAWSDRDVKAPPLKRVQGLIWAEGYARSTLTGHVYDDVPEALSRWRQAGIDRYVYSSGSVAAQRDWFTHSDHGDLSALLNGYFDLSSAGGKREPESYRAITRAIGVPADETVFFSDVGEELDAATAAGWRAVAVRRPGDPRGGAVPGHPTVPALDDVQLHRRTRREEETRT